MEHNAIYLHLSIWATGNRFRSKLGSVPASFPLAIMLVATSLMVLCEGPEEVMVVTRQAFRESQ